MSNKKKKKVGRPTKYNKAVQKKAEDYLGCFSDNGDVIPSTEGLAEYLMVNRSTVYEWRDKHQEFSDTLERIQSNQKCITLNQGLKGDFNASIAKLVLANHGYHDKVDNQNDYTVTPTRSIEEFYND